MCKRSIIALSLTLLFVVASALAKEKDEHTCFRLHPEITSPVEMVTCTSDLAGSREKLNHGYGALAKKLKSLSSDSLTKTNDPVPLALLEKAQRTWLAYRVAQCEYESGGQMNTTGSSAVIACTADMNRARATGLENDLRRWSE